MEVIKTIGELVGALSIQLDRPVLWRDLVSHERVIWVFHEIYNQDKVLIIRYQITKYTLWVASFEDLGSFLAEALNDFEEGIFSRDLNGIMTRWAQIQGGSPLLELDYDTFNSISLALTFADSSYAQLQEAEGKI